MRRTTPGVVRRPPIRVVSADQVLLGRRRAPGRTRALDNYGLCLRPLPLVAALHLCRVGKGAGTELPHNTISRTPCPRAALREPRSRWWARRMRDFSSREIRASAPLPTLQESSLWPSLVEQREGPQRRTVRHVRQVWIAAALRIDAAKPADHRDILLAVLLPRDGLADDAGGVWKLHSTLPFSASSACSSPVITPVNTRSLAVTMVEE